MSTLADWLWNPFLSLLYLVLGVVFLWLTGAIAWRKSLRVLRAILRTDGSDYERGLLSHKKAFLTSIAATVGIGNLAGVGTAIHLGGPGALFWMWVSALAGMTFRMTSTYMAVKHRPARTDSVLFATPMVYLEKYIKAPWRWITPVVAGLLLVQGLVLANIIQSNSVSDALRSRFDIPSLMTAILLTLSVAIVLVGELRRIVEFSSAVVPWMILVYVGAGLLVLLGHPLRTMESLGLVFRCAFSPYSVTGGVVGYSVLAAMQFGVSRGVFSHGSGSAISPFLQGANEDHPAKSAFMAAITPVVDTLIVCTITGLVILSTTYWQDSTGAFLTSRSFEAGVGFTGQLIVISCLVLFAFTTIVTYAYYSERCFQYLGGKRTSAFRLFFVSLTFCGPFLDLPFIWSVSDILIGLLIVFHLFPLLYVMLLNLPTMRKDLSNHGRLTNEGSYSGVPFR